MPQVIDQFLFEPITPMLPGETRESENIDVSGAQYLSVNIEVTGANVERHILFGREFPAEGITGFLALHTDTLDPDGALMTFTPVHGPRMLVRVINKGDERAVIQAASVYGIREVP